MEHSEYVNVELERYEDLIIAEEQLRTLKNIIFKNLRYIHAIDGLVIDGDKAIMSYLESGLGFDLKSLREHAKAQYEKENKE